jgi:hypothetical protein
MVSWQVDLQCIRTVCSEGRARREKKPVGEIEREGCTVCQFVGAVFLEQCWLFPCHFHPLVSLASLYPLSVSLLFPSITQQSASWLSQSTGTTAVSTTTPLCPLEILLSIVWHLWQYAFGCFWSVVVSMLNVFSSSVFSWHKCAISLACKTFAHIPQYLTFWDGVSAHCHWHLPLMRLCTWGNGCNPQGKIVIN